MSTGQECAIVEAQPDRWYLLLEFGRHPDGGWLDDCYSFGPFASDEATFNYLQRHFANPGGHWVEPYTGPLDAGTAKAVERAKHPNTIRRRYR